MQFTVSRDFAWVVLTAALIVYILRHQPEPPDDRTAHRQPAPRPGREPERESSEHGDESKVTPLRAAGFATEAVPA